MTDLLLFIALAKVMSVIGLPAMVAEWAVRKHEARR